MSNDLYKGQCGSCKNYLIDDLRGADRDGYGCKYQGKIFGSPYYKRFPFDYSCGGYKKDYNRSDKDIDKALKALNSRYGYRPGKSTWWYIVTFVADMLNTDIADECFITFAEFRSEILEGKIIKYAAFLVEYDMYGRLIANSLYQDEQKEIVARELLTNYIIPTCNLINEEIYDEALNIYMEMFEKLKEMYNITTIKDYDFTNTLSLDKDQISKLTR